jgi:hypothetical protein
MICILWMRTEPIAPRNRSSGGLEGNYSVDGGVNGAHAQGCDL